MSIIDDLSRQAGRIAGDVQSSLRRARVEGERRLLQRQHRAALEELGERAYALVASGELPEQPLAAEVAAVRAKLAEIETKAAEIDGAEVTGETGADGGEPAGNGGTAAPATSEDPSRTAFPMVGGDRPAGAPAAEAPAPTTTPTPGASTPGPGWEAAERFFRKG